MNAIKYRLGALEDLEQLIELRALMQLEANQLSDELVTPEYLEKAKTFFSNGLKDQSYSSTVAVIDKKVIATAGACFYYKPPSLIGGTGLVGYVTNVYTRNEFRKRGIGTILMKNLNQLALDRKADKLHLGATADGLGIYLAVGFKDPSFVNLEIKFN
jgi:GNAT superfamily N-acetyltransferase